MVDPLMILIAGPYRSGTGDDAAKMKRVGDAAFDEIFHPIAERLVARCDAVLSVGGPFAGADERTCQLRWHVRRAPRASDRVRPAGYPSRRPAVSALAATGRTAALPTMTRTRCTAPSSTSGMAAGSTSSPFSST
jgi:hypothetical protein